MCLCPCLFKHNTDMKPSIITRQSYFIPLSILCIISALVVVIFRLFSVKDLWYETYAAIIGVVITAIITFILLKGQTENDEERERNTKIFEEKLRIYQGFLQSLCDVIKDGEIKPEEAIQLQFQTSYIAIHTKSEHIRKISEHVRNIIEQMGNMNSQEKKESLLDDLFEIVQQFRAELYMGIEPTDEDKQNYNASIKAFESIADAVYQRNGTDEGLARQAHETTSGFGSAVLTGIREALGEEWEVKSEGLHLNISCNRWGGNERLALWITSETADKKYYFQVYMAVPEYRDIYKTMQHTFGGGFNKYGWWCYLKDEYSDLENHVAELADPSSGVARYIVETIVLLSRYSYKYMKVHTIYTDIMSKNIIDQKWRAWIYRNTTIALDYDNSKERLFVDVYYSDSGTIQLLIGSRQKNKAALTARLQQSGLNGQLNSDGKFVYASGIAEEDVERELDRLLKKLG